MGPLAGHALAPAVPGLRGALPFRLGATPSAPTTAWWQPLPYRGPQVLDAGERALSAARPLEPHSQDPSLVSLSAARG
jgi:hypothetical protein